MSALLKSSSEQDTDTLIWFCLRQIHSPDEASNI